MRIRRHFCVLLFAAVAGMVAQTPAPNPAAPRAQAQQTVQPKQPAGAKPPAASKSARPAPQGKQQPPPAKPPQQGAQTQKQQKPAAKPCGDCKAKVLEVYSLPGFCSPYDTGPYDTPANQMPCPDNIARMPAENAAAIVKLLSNDQEFKLAPNGNSQIIIFCQIDMCSEADKANIKKIIRELAQPPKSPHIYNTTPMPATISLPAADPADTIRKIKDLFPGINAVAAGGQVVLRSQNPITTADLAAIRKLVQSPAPFPVDLPFFCLSGSLSGPRPPPRLLQEGDACPGRRVQSTSAKDISMALAKDPQFSVAVAPQSTTRLIVTCQNSCDASDVDRITSAIQTWATPSPAYFQDEWVPDGTAAAVSTKITSLKIDGITAQPVGGSIVRLSTDTPVAQDDVTSLMLPYRFGNPPPPAFRMFYQNPAAVVPGIITPGGGGGGTLAGGGGTPSGAGNPGGSGTPSGSGTTTPASTSSSSSSDASKSAITIVSTSETSTKSSSTSDDSSQTAGSQAASATPPASGDDSSSDSPAKKAPVTTTKTTVTVTPPPPPAPGSPAPPPAPPPVAANMVPVLDTVVFTETSNEALTWQRVRLLTMLDLPRPEVLMNAWSYQASSSNSKDVLDSADKVRDLVAGQNDALENVIQNGWSYLSRQMRLDPLAGPIPPRPPPGDWSGDSAPADPEKVNYKFFDAGFYEYITQKFVVDEQSIADQKLAPAQPSELSKPPALPLYSPLPPGAQQPSQTQQQTTPQPQPSAPQQSSESKPPPTPIGLSDNLRRRWGFCPADKYCLGYTQAFQPVRPNLTSILLGAIASKRPLRTILTTIGCMEGKYEVYGVECFPDRFVLQKEIYKSEKDKPNLRSKVQELKKLQKQEDQTPAAAAQTPPPCTSDCKSQVKTERTKLETRIDDLKRDQKCADCGAELNHLKAKESELDQQRQKLDLYNKGLDVERACLRSERQKLLQEKQFKQKLSCEVLDTIAIEAQEHCGVAQSAPLSCFTIQAAQSFSSPTSFSTFTLEDLNSLAEEKLADSIAADEAEDRPPSKRSSETANDKYPRETMTLGSPYGTTRIGLLRAAIADFLFNYKMSQEFPQDFIAYDLQHSAQELNAELNPLVVAFNQDVAAYSRHLSDHLENGSPHKSPFQQIWGSHAAFRSDGIVTVRGIGGVSSAVDTLTQNYFDATQAQSLSAILNSLSGQGGGGGAGAAGSSAGSAASSVLSQLEKGTLNAGTGLAALSALAPTPTQARIGRQLTFYVTPHTLPGASSAELDVQLLAQEDTPPNLYQSGNATGANDSLSRVARHNVTTRVRVESVKLFELSSFSALLQRPRSKFPLVPPFIELPFIGSVASIPLPGAKEYHRSTAIVSAVIVPTAADLAYGIDFAHDRLVTKERRTAYGHEYEMRSVNSISDFVRAPIRAYHKAMVNCFATNTRLINGGAEPYLTTPPGSDIDFKEPATGPPSCQTLDFTNVPPEF